MIWFGTATIFFTYVLTYLQKLSGQTRNLGKTKSCEATKNKRDAWVMYIISNSNEKKSVFELMDFWRVSKAKPLEFWWCHAEHYSLRAWLFVPTALVHNWANKFIKSHSNWRTQDTFQYVLVCIISFQRVVKFRNWCWILRIFLWFFHCLLISDENKEEKFLIGQDQHFFFSSVLRRWKKDNNKYSTSISMLDDPSKWQNVHIKAGSNKKGQTNF